MAMERLEVLTEINQIGMKDKKNVNLNQYSKKEYPPLEELPKLVKEQKDYKAIEEYKRGKFSRFKIIDATGESYGCSYSHLVEWVYTPPSLISITLSTRIFTIEGQRISEIDRLLVEEKVKELHVFNETKHKKPPQGQTIIQKLTISEAT